MRLALSLAVALGLTGNASASPLTPPAAVPFATYDAPYFVRNDFQPGLPRSYAVVRSWSTFQTIFGVGATMNGPKATIGPQTFRSKMLLVAIVRGPLCSFAAAKVDRTSNGISLVYALRCPAQGSAKFAVPLIVAVDQSQLPVGFVENGRTIEVVPGARSVSRTAKRRSEPR